MVGRIRHLHGPWQRQQLLQQQGCLVVCCCCRSCLSQEMAWLQGLWGLPQLLLLQLLLELETAGQDSPKVAGLLPSC
jgi:hypothetical protein